MSNRSIAELKQRTRQYEIELADLAIQCHEDLSAFRKTILETEVARVEHLKSQEEVELEQAELGLEAMRLSWF